MNKAFTLIELIFVVVIIGIIASVVVPKMKQVKEQQSTQVLERGSNTTYKNTNTKENW